MKKILAIAFASVAMVAGAHAATVTNTDGGPVTLIVTDGGDRSELVVAAGETVDFCPSGCFVTMPNGDREALTGAEAIEIAGGKAVFK